MAVAQSEPQTPATPAPQGFRIAASTDNLTEAEEFLGEVMVDEVEAGKYGPQWHVGVRPLMFQIKGQTGMFHEYFGVSTRKTSKMGIAIALVEQVWGKGLYLGEGMLKGRAAWFVRKDLKFGKNRETGEDMIAEQVLLPVRAASAEDLAGVGASAASPVATPAAPAWGPEQIAAVVDVMLGKTKQEMQLAAARSLLPADLKNAILSGQALEYLLASGIARLSAEGRVEIAADAPADSDAVPGSA